MQPIVAMCVPYGIMSIVKGKENRSTKEVQSKTKRKAKERSNKNETIVHNRRWPLVYSSTQFEK